MRRFNPHHGWFLGDNFTPEIFINSSFCYWKGVKIFQLRKVYNELNSSTNLLSSSYCLSLFEISFIGVVLRHLWSKEKNSWRAWHSPGQRKTKITFHRYTKNPSLNKEEIWAWISSLSLSLSLVIWVFGIVVIFHWFKKNLQYIFSNSLPVQEMVTPLEFLSLLSKLWRKMTPPSWKNGRVTCHEIRSGKV